MRGALQTSVFARMILTIFGTMYSSSITMRSFLKFAIDVISLDHIDYISQAPKGVSYKNYIQGILEQYISELTRLQKGLHIRTIYKAYLNFSFTILIDCLDGKKARIHQARSNKDRMTT